MTEILLLIVAIISLLVALGGLAIVIKVALLIRKEQQRFKDDH